MKHNDFYTTDYYDENNRHIATKYTGVDAFGNFYSTFHVLPQPNSGTAFLIIAFTLVCSHTAAYILIVVAQLLGTFRFDYASELSKTITFTFSILFVMALTYILASVARIPMFIWKKLSK